MFILFFFCPTDRPTFTRGRAMRKETFYGHGLSGAQIKWTECKKWKRNSEKFNFLLNISLWFRIKYSRNWECFDRSCVNRTVTVHGTLRFLYLSHLLHGICVKIFIMNQYISKSYTTSKNTIDRQYTEQGQL